MPVFYLATREPSLFSNRSPKSRFFLKKLPLILEFLDETWQNWSLAITEVSL